MLHNLVYSQDLTSTSHWQTPKPFLHLKHGLLQKLVVITTFQIPPRKTACWRTGIRVSHCSVGHMVDLTTPIQFDVHKCGTVCWVTVLCPDQVAYVKLLGGP